MVPRRRARARRTRCSPRGPSGSLEGEDVVAGEGGGDPGEGGAGVLVHLEVLAAGVLRDLLEADLEGVPRRFGDVQAEDGGASLVESRAGRVVVGIELHRAALQPPEAIAEEEDRLGAGYGKKRPGEGEKRLLRRRRVEGLLAVEGGRERRWVGRRQRPRPAEQDRLVQDAAHRVEVRREVEVEAQVRVVGEHGHAVARREWGEELLGLPDGAEETAQAAALEVLLEEEDDEAAGGDHRRRGGGRPRAREPRSSTRPPTPRTRPRPLRPSTSRRKSSGVRPGSGRPAESVTRTSRTTREVSTPGSR